MAGELSRKIGEDGEKLARKFLKQIGWTAAVENQDIACVRPKDHEKKEIGETTHGIDFIVAYDCPLVHSTRRNILISMKNSNVEETKGETSKVRDNLKDLDRALDCYRRSELRKMINESSDLSIIEDSGLLIKINRDRDESESFLKNSPNNKMRLDLSSGNELHFIENKRFDLVDLAYGWLKKERSIGKTHCYYPSTTSNYAADVAEIHGDTLPLHHLIAGPLIFRHTNDTTKEMIIFSPSNFKPTIFERLVGLANGCSNGWAGKVTIVFPELGVQDKNRANESLLGIRSTELAKSVRIESLDPRSRTQ